MGQFKKFQKLDTKTVGRTSWDQDWEGTVGIDSYK